MSNLLLTAKRSLREAALELYSTYEEDLEMDKDTYRDHYSDLGEILYTIESCDTLGLVILKLEAGLFNQIGFQGIDADAFLEGLSKIK